MKEVLTIQAALGRTTEKWAPKYPNSTYRRLNQQRSVFPSDTALLKALYPATFEATKRWTTTIMLVNKLTSL